MLRAIVAALRSSLQRAIAVSHVFTGDTPKGADRVNVSIPANAITLIDRALGRPDESGPQADALDPLDILSVNQLAEHLQNGRFTHDPAKLLPVGRLIAAALRERGIALDNGSPPAELQVAPELQSEGETP